MKRTVRKWLTALLLVCMAATLPGGDAWGESAPEEKTYRSGSFEYVLREDGGACITGYTSLRIDLLNLVIPESLDGHPVVAIRKLASKTYGTIRWPFDFYHLRSITLPDSLTSIEGNPFYDIGEIDIVVSPDHPTLEVVDGVLYDTALRKLIHYSSKRQAKEFTVPENIVSIGAMAFANCESLTSITLPNSLLTIEEAAFNSNEVDLVVSPDHPTLEVVDGVLYDKVSRTLLYYPAHKQATEYTVPEGTKAIARRAFSICNSLRSITLPEGLTSIEDDAIYCCLSLTSVTLPKGLTSIGNGAFSYCYSLSDITLPEGLTSIGDGAFYACYNLTEINIPDSVDTIGENPFARSKIAAFAVSVDHPTLAVIDGVLYDKTTRTLIAYPPACDATSFEVPEGIIAIGDSAFEKCALRKVVLPKGLTTIGNNAFGYCTDLYDITLPEGLTSIGNYAFLHCESLTILMLPKGLTSIGAAAFSACEVLHTVVLQRGLTVIENLAFAGCEALSNIELPEGLTSIGDGAFGGCQALRGVALPSSLISIGDMAFSECTSLDITLPEGLKSIGFAAFGMCTNLYNVVLPEGLISIGDMAFAMCENLNGSIKVPDSVRFIEGHPFAATPMTAFIISPDHPRYAQIDGVLYEKTTKTLVAYPGGRDEISFSVPEGIVAIGNSAFADSDLYSIMLPEGLISIGNNAFYFCRNLTDIMLPEGLTSIGDRAFADCSALTGVTLPASLMKIGQDAFDNDNSSLMLTVPRDSCARQYAIDNHVNYTYVDANDWLLGN